MSMFSDDLEILEFYKFKDFLSKNFNSVFAESKLNGLKPYNNEQETILMQNYLLEAFEICNSEVSLPYDKDLNTFLVKLEDKFSVFELNDFIVFSNFFKQLGDYKRHILDSFNMKYLNKKFSDISTFKELTDSISDKITNDGKIKNNASETLYKIRKLLHEVNGNIKLQLNKLLNQSNSDKFIRDRIITMRNNRFTVMCKPNFRQYIKGIIQDVSDSKQTYYIEPSSIVEANNRFQQLKIEEETEILRIVKEIRDSILNYKNDIDFTVNAFSEIAYFVETAKFYKSYKFVMPNFTDEINLKEIHHPLLLFNKKEGSVPIDLEIGKNEKTVVISGPNTGGKTASLKSLGLNTLIAKCGLPVFADFADFIYFDKIFADIGDHQSILMDFSTFSSHMLNIKRIIDNADENSLILFDELGTGTEPKEGAYLAVSILKYLNEKRITTAVTTHFSEVKHFAISKDNGIIYAVDFDYEKFIPSYKLLKGVEGKSDPFIVAKKLNFPEEIINYSIELAKQNQSLIELSLEEINEMKSQIAKKLHMLREKEQVLEEKLKQIQLKEENLNKKLNKKETDLLEETYMLLNKARSMVKRKPKSISIEEVEKNLNKTSKKLNELKSKRKTLENVKENDLIYLEKYKKQARILRVENKNVFVDLEGIKVSIPKTELVGRKLEEKSKKNKIKITDRVEKIRKSEIVLVGKTVEEAEEILDKYFDEQILSGTSQVAVIHGRGSGKLKKGIHEFLKKDPRVASFRIAESKEGGQAVTIVNF